MPNPPRTLVFPFPKTSQANPNRGAQSFLSGKFDPVGAPGSPGKTMPAGALTKRCECRPGITEKERPCKSFLGELYSYRTPSVTVKFLRRRHSSWANPPKCLLRMFEGASPNCV